MSNHISPHELFHISHIRKSDFRDLENNNLRILLALFTFNCVRNFDHSPAAMLKISALLKEKIPAQNLRTLLISKPLT